ncbi:MAG: hypothetical protein H7141_11195 [Burkholderiales bacterium]|nr:hypothetical protein [Bacteroidia bacterium]
MKLIFNICFICAIIFLSNCTINKRHYRGGYKLSWNKTKIKISDQTKNEEVELSHLNDLNKFSEPENEDVLYASSKKSIYPTNKKKIINSFILPQDSCGDLITMLNGEEISVKVIEINQSIVKYRTCDNLDGPLFIESKDKIFMIRYVNGTKEVFPKTTSKPAVKVNTDNKNTKDVLTGNSAKKINTMALVSLICCGAFFLYIPLVLAPIFAIIACSQFKKYPDKYKAKGMVIPALIVGALIVTILVLLLLSVIIV